MVLGELLVLADDDQSEFSIRVKGSLNKDTYIFMSEIPRELYNRVVYSILGYNAEGYDGLEVTIL